MTRLRIDPRHHALKVATRRLIKANGGLSEAKLHCRVGKTALSDQQCESSPLFMAIDVVADLEQEKGVDYVSACLFQMSAKSVFDHEPLDRLHRITEIVQEVSEAVGALGNGDTQEAIREIDEAVEALQSARRDILARQCAPARQAAG